MREPGKKSQTERKSKKLVILFAQAQVFQKLGYVPVFYGLNAGFQCVTFEPFTEFFALWVIRGNNVIEIIG